MIGEHSVPSVNYHCTLKSHCLSSFVPGGKGATCSQNASVSGSPSAMITSKFIIKHYKT